MRELVALGRCERVDLLSATMTARSGGASRPAASASGGGRSLGGVGEIDDDVGFVERAHRGRSHRFLERVASG